MSSNAFVEVPWIFRARSLSIFDQGSTDHSKPCWQRSDKRCMLWDIPHNIHGRILAILGLHTCSPRYSRLHKLTLSLRYHVFEFHREYMVNQHDSRPAPSRSCTDLLLCAHASTSHFGPSVRALPPLPDRDLAHWDMDCNTLTKDDWLCLHRIHKTSLA